MKKLSPLFLMLVLAVSSTATARVNFFSRQSNKNAQSVTVKDNRSNNNTVFKSVSQDYKQGKISSDSVINIALYHKVWSPELAQKILNLISDTPRGAMELGVIYAFTPEYSKQASEGVKLLQQAAKSGINDANAYLGLYYFNHGDYAKAKSYFDACNPLGYGFGYTAIGSMYMEGKGVKENIPAARDNYHKAALLGYPRGMALYGFNMRATAGGKVSYPESFFWLYIAGDLGDDAARATLGLSTRGEKRASGEVGEKAATALQFIQAVQAKKIQNDPLYKEGFLPGLKIYEQSAEQGDDWARFYLGSMNYNDDFLNRNYAQALHYYEPIVQNAQLPKNVLATVNRRIAEIYTQGNGVTKNPEKAAYHNRMAAKLGNLTAYKIVEGISD
ncbi:MAG: hypothetical protein K2J74_03815 [Muribaculaceae bacterium]|nr:hypothetical protein [Muribaculaceae bacterium]